MVLVGIGLGKRSLVEFGRIVCEMVEGVLGWIEDFGIRLDEIGNLSSPHSSTQSLDGPSTPGCKC